jgi:sulfide:quinone oxidoreductase
MKRVVIAGGGFAGLEAAIDLKKAGFEVTLVSNRDYMYIYPVSIWIPTKQRTFDETCIPLVDLQKAHGFDLIIDEVTTIRTDEKTVALKKGDSLSYDYLILAMGAGKMPHDGIENTYSICGEPKVSMEISDRLETLVRKGHGKIAFGFGGNPKDTSAVRGGPGFELMFNVHNYLTKLGIRDRFELTFFAPMEKPGARMGEKALKMMDKMFSMQNLKRSFGKKIKRFERDGVVFEDESRLDSDLVLYIPANAGHPVIRGSNLPQNEAGFVTINDYCEVEGLENVYAVGDTAAIEGPQWRAKQGHIAEVMARNAAFNIIAKEKGSAERKGYIEHLNILCVMDTGNGAAFVYRDDKKAMMLPMPVVGHWMKRGWGVYCRMSKLGRFPRIF